MDITIGGDEIEEITIDGDYVEEVTIDGDPVWYRYKPYIHYNVDYNLTKLDPNGQDVLWEVDTSSSEIDIGSTQDLLVIDYGYIYLLDYRGDFLKFDRDGNVEKHLKDFFGSGSDKHLDNDDEDNIYAYARNNLYKLDKDLNIIWNYDAPDKTTYCFSVDKDRYSYFATAGPSGGDSYKIFKISPTGSLVWDYDIPMDGEYNDLATDLVVDSNGNLYYGSAGGKFVKLDSSGGTVWSKDFNDVSSVCEEIDKMTIKDNYLYIGGEKSPAVSKFDTDGNEIWYYSVNDYGQEIEIDSNDDIYYVDNSDVLFKLDNDGNKIWEKSYSEIIRGLSATPKHY